MDGLGASQVVGKRIKSYREATGENDRLELEDGTIIIAMSYGGLAWFELYGKDDGNSLRGGE